MAEPYQKLAVALSVAVRIEPELIRAVRLAVFPRFDVSAEADLWFSPLVRSRGPHGIVFDQDVVVGLRAELSSWLRSAPESDPVHALGEVLSSVHKRLSPALALEERVTWLAVNGQDDAIDGELLPALKALVEENRGGIADWFTAAWHRLPPNVRQSVTAWKLAQLVRPDLNGSAPSLGLLRMPGAGPDLSDIVPLLPDVRMLLRRIGNSLEIGNFEPTDDTVGILVPDTDPRLLTVGTEAVAVRRDARTSVAVALGPVRVTTARGAVYEVSDAEPPVGRLLVVDVPLVGMLDVPVPSRSLEQLGDALGTSYRPSGWDNPTEDDVRTALDELAGSRLDGPLVLYWRGPATLRSGLPYLLLNDNTSTGLDQLMSAAVSSGADQILMVLDIVTSDETASLRWRGLVDNFAPAAPMWVGLVISASAKYDDPLSEILSALLTSGPSHVEDQRRWSSTGEYVTGFDVCHALSAETGDQAFAFDANQGAPLPMFRNPLHRGEIGRAAPSAARWFDVTEEVRIVLGWLEAGQGNVFVIAGAPGSGKTAILDEVERRVDLERMDWFSVVGGFTQRNTSSDIIAIDGLTSATMSLDHLAEMRASGARVLVTIDSGSPSLPELAPAGPDLDLDDVRAYALRRLSGADPEASAGEITTYLVETMKLPPALVRRTAHELQVRRKPTDQPRWQDRVLSALHEAFVRDLGDSPRSRMLLQALAWAHGPGLPVPEWLACAHALAPDDPPFTSEEAESALYEFGHYVASNIRGHRIVHSILAKALRRDTSDPLVRQRIVGELSKLVPATGQASAYLLSRLRDHVTEAGRAGLPHLRILAKQDRRWLPDLGFTAYELAARDEGKEVVDLAEEAVNAYTQHVTAERRGVAELRRALDLLTSCLRAAERFKQAEQVWPKALADMPANIAKWVGEGRKTPTRTRSRTSEPKPPQQRGIRPYDMVVLVPGIKDNVLRRAHSTPLPPDLGDSRPRGGAASAALDTGGYGRMLALLNRLGYQQEKRNLVTLPYDWRLSHRLTGRLLGEQVEDALITWRKRGSQDAKVVFLCVSTGGLPARWYVERCGGAQLTAGMITIGTPYQGAMRDLDKLVNNTWERGTEEFWRSLPSTYQALPIYRCIEEYDERVLPTRALLPGVERHRIADGAAFLNDLLDAEVARPDSLPTTHTIVGYGHQTLSRARVAQGRMVAYDPNAHQKVGSGDSYVPMFAAAHPSVPDDRIIKVESTHDLLHRNYRVLDAVERVLPAASRPRRR